MKYILLVLIFINIIIAYSVMNHYYHLPIRTVIKVEEKVKTVTKKKTVHINDASKAYIDLMNAASDVCDKRANVVKHFKVDKDNRPEFNCE